MLLLLQVDVEAHEVQERELEIFGGGVVHIGDEALGVLGLDGAVRPPQVAFDRSTAEPSGYGAGDLVADGIAQQRRVPGALPGHAADQRLDLAHVPLPIDEQAQVLLGGERDHDPKALSLGGVEQGSRRHRVRNAHSIEAARRHLGEVALYEVEALVLATVWAGGERPVSHATHVDLFIAGEEELALHAGSDVQRDGGERVGPGGIPREDRSR